MTAQARASRHWAEVGENTFVAGIWALYGVHHLFGRRVLRMILYPVTLFYWLARPQAARASLDYLRRLQSVRGVFGATVPGFRHSLRHFHSFAETILDKLLALGGRYPAQRLRFVGRDLVNDMVAQGQGGILVTAHVGCLELCQAAASGQSGLRLTVLVHTRHAERFNHLLRRLDPDSPVRLLQVTEVDASTAVVLAQRVANGEFVAIAGDRVPVTASKTVLAPFLGQDAPFPVGAYVLASLFRCPLLLLACTREGAGHVVRFERLALRVELPRGRRQEAMAQLAAQFARRLEELLALAPYDWFNFYPFWTQPAGGSSPNRTP